MLRFFVIFLIGWPIFSQAQDRYLVDWEAISNEALNHFTELLRINTTNPPGNETAVANYLRDALANDAIEGRLYALEPGRDNLVARVAGNGSKRPVLVMGHTDVVGVQRENWSVDPFGAVRRGG